MNDHMTKAQGEGQGCSMNDHMKRLGAWMNHIIDHMCNGEDLGESHE